MMMTWKDNVERGGAWEEREKEEGGGGDEREFQRRRKWQREMVEQKVLVVELKWDPCKCCLEGGVVFDLMKMMLPLDRSLVQKEEGIS